MPARLVSLRVDKFRHVRPGTTIEFGSKFNTVVGQNGAGKTTLLELVSAIIRNDFGAFAGDELRLHFRLTDGAARLDGTLRNRVNSSVANSTTLELEATLTLPRGSISIESDPARSVIVCRGKEYSAAPVPVFGNLGLIAAISVALPDTPEFQGYKSDLAGFRSLAACARLAEGVETFWGLFSEHVIRELSPEFGVTLIQSVHGPLVLNHNLSDRIVFPEFRPPVQNVDIVTVGGAAEPLLRFVELSQYTGARLIFSKTSVTNINGVVRQVFANPLARFTTCAGNEIPHHVLSFGEKRLLTFLLKLSAYPHTIIVDELANGMHHAWLERCIELMDEHGTQAFLSSQNPLLLDCLPLSRETFGSEHALVICEFDESGEMIWRNLSPAETEDFFKSHDVGIQHVSEIMRSKGLW